MIEYVFLLCFDDWFQSFGGLTICTKFK